jgi:hypothetical protein
MRLALALLLCSTSLADAAPRCAAEAKERAKALLAFHADEKPDQLEIDDKVKALAPIKALKGKLDVVEVIGHIYKADYRMRFIYVQEKESCTLVGEEILEAGNPY